MSMTNEQREAVEICKEKIIEPFYNFPNPISIELKDTDVGAIETILSLIKEQNKYIKDANDITTEMSNDIKKLTSEIEKKDKQIDLMAERINWLCKTNGILLDREHGVNFTEEDIKQYFERKVEDVKD